MTEAMTASIEQVKLEIKKIIYCPKCRYAIWVGKGDPDPERCPMCEEELD